MGLSLMLLALYLVSATANDAPACNDDTCQWDEGIQTSVDVSESDACEDGGTCNAVHSNSLLQTIGSRDRQVHTKELNAVFHAAQMERLEKESEYFEQYTKYVLLNVYAKNPTEMDLLQEVESHSEIVGLVDWEAAEMSGNQLLVVPPNLADEVKSNLTHGGLTYGVHSEDFAHDLEEEHAANVNAFKPEEPYDIVGRVPSLDELYAWEDMMNRTHSTVELFDYGVSAQGRSLRGMKIKRHDNLPIVLLTCSMHAREWITMPACVYWINALVNNKTDQWLMDRVEWHFLPMYNPDGYVRSQNVNRLWRKNVRDLGFTKICNESNPNLGLLREHVAVGVDLNRNFNTSIWGKANNANPCNEQYLGPEPFSEPENRAFKEWVMAHQKRIKVYHDIHAIGQMWLIPPGGIPLGANVMDYLNSDLLEIAKEAARLTELNSKGGRKYTYGSPIQLGLTGGSAMGAGGGSFDWAYDPVRGPGIKYVFASELPPTNAFYCADCQDATTVREYWQKFAASALTVHPKDIEPAAQEYWEGIKHTIDVALRDT